MNSLVELIDNPREEEVQKYLTKNQKILLEAFGSHWDVNECIPKFKFGNEYVSDYVIISGQSFMYDIILIELEPPTEKPFNKDGSYSRRLNGAVKQVTDWIEWIRCNQFYFLSSISSSMNNKYGAEQITNTFIQNKRSFINTKIVIGQRKMMSLQDNIRRATILSQYNKTLEIVPYDRLIDIEKKLRS